MITQAIMVIMLRHGTLMPAIITLVWKSSGRVIARALGEMASSAVFCSKVLTAKEVIRIAVSDLSRTGRKATSSVKRLVTIPATIASKPTASHGSEVNAVSRYMI